MIDEEYKQKLKTVAKRLRDVDDPAHNPLWPVIIDIEQVASGEKEELELPHSRYLVGMEGL